MHSMAKTFENSFNMAFQFFFGGGGLKHSFPCSPKYTQNQIHTHIHYVSHTLYVYFFLKTCWTVMLFRYYYKVYLSPNSHIKEDMRWVGHVARMEEKRNSYRTLARKPEAKGLLWKCRHRWILKERGWEGMGWIHLLQSWNIWWVPANTVTKLQFPQNLGKFLTSLITTSFSRMTLLHGISPSDVLIHAILHVCHTNVFITEKLICMWYT